MLHVTLQRAVENKNIYFEFLTFAVIDTFLKFVPTHLKFGINMKFKKN